MVEIKVLSRYVVISMPVSHITIESVMQLEEILVDIIMSYFKPDSDPRTQIHRGDWCVKVDRYMVIV